MEATTPRLSLADGETATVGLPYFGNRAPEFFNPTSHDEVLRRQVPVRRVTLVPTQSTSEITQVTRQTFPDSLFVVPEGFTKEAMGMGRGRGRGRGPQ